MPKYAFRRYLSAPGLIKEVRACFERIEDNGNGKVFSLSDCLMSGFAVFSLKYPSLLQFDQGREDDLVRANLKSLYSIDRAPSDTYLRERLDNVSPELLRRSFRRNCTCFSVAKVWRDSNTWMVIIFYPLMERVIFLLHKCIVNNAARNITVTVV